MITGQIQLMLARTYQTYNNNNYIPDILLSIPATAQCVPQHLINKYMCIGFQLFAKTRDDNFPLRRQDLVCTKLPQLCNSPALSVLQCLFCVPPHTYIPVLLAGVWSCSNYTVKTRAECESLRDKLREERCSCKTEYARKCLQNCSSK